MINRAAWFLASALDRNKPPHIRKAAYVCYEIERYYDSVISGLFPIMAVPVEYIAQVRSRVFERHEGPITGFQIRA